MKRLVALSPSRGWRSQCQSKRTGLILAIFESVLPIFLLIRCELRPGDLMKLRLAIWLPTVLKLAVFPALLAATAMAFGVTGVQLSYLALCGAVPTAMNGYLLTGRLGGDAELYAAVTTFQTGLSFLTIPTVLALTAQLNAG
jgi:malonate transporter and related proteins